MNSAFRAKATARLSALPSKTLADALLELAEWSKDAENLIETLITTSEESVATFKRKLSGIKRRTKFYNRSAASAFGNELSALLDLLRKPAIPPKDTLEALVLFFQADSKLMEMADDSYGDMGHIYQSIATPLFAETAARIDDQKFLIKTFQKLHEKNGYGVRDHISEHAKKFLTTESIEELRQYYQTLSKEETNHSQARILTKELAAQLANPEAFEAELRKVNDHYYHANLTELAKIYQAANRHQDLASRLDEWLTLIPAHHQYDLEKIAVETYSKLSMPEKAHLIRQQAFLRSPSKTALQELSNFASPAQIQNIKKQALDQILDDKSLNTSHLRFLQDTGQHLLANDYLLARHQQLDGDTYYPLPDLALSFSSQGYLLAASLIWRALTDAILAHASLKAYPHAAKHLSSLHQAAPEIETWLDHPTHTSYLQQLHRSHYRKISFWKKVTQEIIVLSQASD